MEALPVVTTVWGSILDLLQLKHEMNKALDVGEAIEEKKHFYDTYQNVSGEIHRPSAGLSASCLHLHLRIERKKSKRREHYHKSADRIKSLTREYHREYYHKNADRIKSKRREYRQKNAERVKLRKQELERKMEENLPMQKPKAWFKQEATHLKQEVWLKQEA